MSNNYTELRAFLKADPTAAKRCIERLIKIRSSLNEVRRRKSDGTLLLATWNLRDFDSNKFGFGFRLRESFYYIAEMISAFDLVAVQEVNRDLSGLRKVMRILGREWDYIATDATEGPGGNAERMVFIFNTEKVWFRKIAGEVVLPDGQLIVSPKVVKPPKDQKAVKAKPRTREVEQQFARTPFLVAFQSGWFHFSLCTVHIYYGKDTGPQLKRRIAEIEKLVEFFAKRQDEDTKQEIDNLGNVENYILLGDFNVVSPDHQTMEALKGQGFKVPEQIDGDRVRKDGDHFYDQIAVRVKDPRFKVNTGGLVDLYADVFREEDLEIYEPLMPKKDPEKNKKFQAKSSVQLYKKWRTWQMSDHSPLWIEIGTDFTENYLSGLVNPAIEMASDGTPRKKSKPAEKLLKVPKRDVTGPKGKTSKRKSTQKRKKSASS
ncbi:endonuclease/exonuclease/phosphatase family protein [uncultured Bradyrhizobium sp.]|jgi:endonuclease/exonuclease/phosphatase family metal-dependent hydrolase|uniref:endonuclease/exonuclease/phosphatase family protein n=1 Tax=uncultured Bradyrhizobium sp. TaxID=199684 RepID=UPI0026185B71|nr:endonuclease/exonuclease/phosphatase family protein [uncultured Bradyrhizobium sp.]